MISDFKMTEPTFFELLQLLLLENLTKFSLSFLGKKDFHIFRHPLLFVNENEHVPTNATQWGEIYSEVMNNLILITQGGRCSK